jgi:hypothetical protein
VGDKHGPLATTRSSTEGSVDCGVLWFPDFVLQPGQECRVYTDEDHPESCGFNFHYTSSAIWANKGECGHLFDPSGAEVSTYCY